MNFERTKILLGDDIFSKIQNTKILILGLGGVGGTAMEALARMGFSNFILVDFDKIDVTNINRQIITLENNIGKSKVSVAFERIKSINSLAKVEIFEGFVDENNIANFLPVDIVVDAIDSVRV